MLTIQTDKTPNATSCHSVEGNLRFPILLRNTTNAPLGSTMMAVDSLAYRYRGESFALAQRSPSYCNAR